MKSIINNIQRILESQVRKQGSDPYGLKLHLQQVEKWAKFILKNHPEADKKIVLLSVWLHDIGHYPLTKEDHALTGERRAIQILKKNRLNEDTIKRVAHCVRAHRCKDVQPETIEAKILACADSASHFTDYLYFEIVMQNKSNKSNYDPIAKIERDYRDIALFPEVKRKLTPMYKKWKSLLAEFQKLKY